MNVRRRAASPVLLAFLILISVVAVGWARGGREVVEHDDHHVEDQDHRDDHLAMSIPHIDAVNLGAGEQLRVIASTSIIGDVVRQVAGDAAAVTTLIPIGQNPHAWDPTPRAMVEVERAHLVFVNGLDLEEALMTAIERVSTGKIVPVSAGATILDGDDDHDDQDDGDDHDDGDDVHDVHDDDDDHDDDHDDDDHNDDDHAHEGGDPHFWFSPANVMIWTRNIAEALGDADPGNATVFHANADRYIAQLEALDREIRSAVTTIPAERRKLVVDHVALTYFAADYGFEIIGAVIPTTSDQVEPSSRHVAALTELIRHEGVPAVFIGGTANRGVRNLVTAVAREVGGEIRIGEILTGSLSPAGTEGDTYIGFMRYNLTQIVNALTR